MSKNIQLKSIQDLKCIENVQKLVFTKGYTNKIQKIDLIPFSQSNPEATDGVMSTVYSLQITWENSDISSSLSSQESQQQSNFIVKFQRQDSEMQVEPFCSMLKIESEFYNVYRDIWYQLFSEKDNDRKRPFEIPKVLYTADNCLIVHKVLDLNPTCKCYERYSKKMILDLLKRIACMHGSFWGQIPIENKLCSYAGMGGFLTGVEKETMFPSAVSIFLDFVCHEENQNSIFMDNRADCETLRHICSDLSKRRLHEIHDYVHTQFQMTLIHGDLHFGNMLYTRQSDKINNHHHEDPTINSDQDLIYLVDWATCGLGNPLRDVVFFRILCMEVSEEEVQNLFLQNYHQELLLYIQNSAMSETQDSNDLFSWQKCIENYDYCVLNQFIILVCYHDLTQGFLNQEGLSMDVRKDRKLHFQAVYRRCVSALLRSYSRMEDRSLLPSSSNL